MRSMQILQIKPADLNRGRDRRKAINYVCCSDQSTENLRWLTATQALADLAQFIMTMNERYNLVNPKWVTFGGSYPGKLKSICYMHTHT